MSSDVQLTKAQVVVSGLLSKYPETRNSDLLLTWIYFKEVLKVELPPLSWDQFKLLEGKTETVRRMRQFIQNTAKRYPPTRPEVMKKRRQKEGDYREWFGRNAK